MLKIFHKICGYPDILSHADIRQASLLSGNDKDVILDREAILNFEQPSNVKQISDEQFLRNAVHSFNEWQAIVQGLEWLNAVTCQPFGRQMIKTENFFSGSICYNLTQSNDNHENICDSKKNLLEKVLGSPKIAKCYRNYENLVMSIIYPIVLFASWVRPGRVPDATVIDG
uniref:Uncharacterized protein n=1 Tax=Romanomermis culicivorax TaxID=13658 RepID=A0A915JQ07_ROMCU